MTTLSDNFAYSDGTLPDPPWSSPWSGFALPTVVSSHLEAPTSGSTAYYTTHDTQCATQAQFSEAVATISISGQYNEANVLVRMSGTTNIGGYQFAWASNASGTYDYWLYKNNPAGGFSTLVGPVTGAGTGPKTLRIEIDAANNIVCKADGTTVITYTDSSSPLTGTGVGLGIYRESGVVTLDTWSAGDVTVPATPPDAPVAPIIDAARNGRIHAVGQKPTDNGSIITSYVWEISSNGGSTWNPTSQTTLEANIDTLTNDLSYVTRFAAVNAGGQGGWSSASNAKIPMSSDFISIGDRSLLVKPSNPFRITPGHGPGFATSVDPTNRYVLDQYGEPWLCVGFTAWSIAASLNTTDMGLWVANRKAKHATAVIVSFPEPWYAPNAPNNLANQPPFVSGAFASALNEVYWVNVDFFLDACKAAGITVYVCWFYLGYSGGGDGWYPVIEGVTDTNMRDYATAIFTRYPPADYPNIVHFIGHDRIPTATHESRGLAFIDQLRGIHEDPRLLIYGGVHPRDVNGTDTFGIGAEDWVSTAAVYPPDLHTQYDYSEWNIVNADTMNGFSPTRPHFFIEGKYEQEQGIGIGNVLLRKQLIGPWADGGIGGFFGGNPEWNFENKALFGYTGTWESNMNAKGSLFVKAFYEIVTQQFQGWHLTVCDTTSTFVTNRLTNGNRIAVRFNGDLGIIYHPEFTVGNGNMLLDLTEFSGAHATVDIIRIDPANGTNVTIVAGTSTSNSAFSVVVPGVINSEGNDDWLIKVIGL